MEKVWDELKKVEAQANQVRSEAQNGAKGITSLAQRESEKLLEDGKKYANEEAKKIYADTIEEANRSRNQQLNANQEAVEKIRRKAEQQMDQASSTIVAAVLGET